MKKNICCTLASALLISLSGCQKQDVSEYCISFGISDSIITFYGQDPEVTAAIDYIDNELIPYFKACHGDMLERNFTIESGNGQTSDEKALMLMNSLATELEHIEHLGNKYIEELDDERVGAFSLCYALRLFCNSFIDHHHSTTIKEYRIYFNYVGSLPDWAKRQYEFLEYL